MTHSHRPSRPLLPARRFLLIPLVASMAVLAGCGNGDDDAPPPAPEIRTLSNRADLVSGGDVLVEIVAPNNDITGLSVQVGSRDVTAAFARRADGRVTGVVTGLDAGENTLSARTQGSSRAQLTVTNSPRSGPVLSGAQIVPFYCATPTPVVANGNTPGTNASGLAGTADANCNIASETRLYYRSTATVFNATTNPTGCTMTLPDPAWSIGANATTVPAQPAAPANGCFKPYTVGVTPGDLANTTTDTGANVPFIVRVERGTLNRGIYDIVVLIDPAQPWTAVAPQPTWNGKVFYSFGASTGQPRRQTRPANAWTGMEEQLKRGYLVATNSMTDSSRNSNRVLMSETTMMMKEHITDSYGPIKFTLGSGCSGGSINSNMNASISPGLLDGVVTSCTYPDSETTTLEVGDCVVLVEAYQKAPLQGLWGALTQAQIDAKKAAINGHVDQTACHAWYNAFGSNGKAGLYQQRLVSNNATGAITQSATVTNNCELPNTAVYDPANPVATASLPRCNAWSWGESIWGRVPGSPAARDTRDNVGVQYGLKALRDGAITAEEFVALNETVGGIDRDSTARAERSVADPEALDIAYRSGIVANGRQLAKTAIIDLRGWDDSNVPANVPPGLTPGSIPIHHQWFSFAVRDRIVAGVGDANNQALWRFARTGLGAPGTLGNDAFLAMDNWLTAVKADTSNTPIAQKVRTARPVTGAFDTRDFCLMPDEVAQTTRVHDAAVCDANTFLKPSLSPRQVAGGPRAEDVLKCQLKPLVQGDYTAGTFDAGQWTRLQAVFPNGVCDWSRPGVGQTDAVSPLTFRAGPGGVPLPAAPVSSAR